jgi:uncharacterized membrane-anchored protein YitT (DUF2179 family)
MDDFHGQRGMARPILAPAGSRPCALANIARADRALICINPSGAGAITMQPMTPDPARLQRKSPHSLPEDIQGLLTGCLIFALAVVIFRHANLLTGGTAGLAFLVHYAGGWPFGLVLFAVNLPFYVFGQRALGTAFTVKTFCAVSLLALYVELLPHLISFGHIDPVFAAVIAGLLAGIGLLILIRHGASLGGLSVMAIYLQQKRGWRAGTVQMTVDSLILAAGLLVVAPEQVALSVLGAGALNLVIAVNHRSDRYYGV